MNISSSILAHYGVKPFHPTNPYLDSVLKGHQKVCLILLDGSGSAILNAHPKEARLLLDHKISTFFAVNPATTVASTTALLTDRYPLETGFLGWALPFKEYEEKNITVFPNRFQKTGEEVPEPRLMWKKCPITTIDEILNEAGHKAFLDMPIHTKADGYHSWKEAYQKADAFFSDRGEFLYLYITEPDHKIHHKGVKSGSVGRLIRKLAKMVDDFAKKHPDILVLAIADHGLIDIEEKDINDHPALKKMLARDFSIEGRTPSFKVKEGMKEAFEKEFAASFGNDFILYPASKILEINHFGCGKMNPEIPQFIGDYVAVSKSDALLVDKTSESYFPFKAHHAGESYEERAVNLAAWNL